MNLTAERSTCSVRDTSQGRGKNRRFRTPLHESRGRNALKLECLEDRALLSTFTLSGFPAGGFRSTTLDGMPPWAVALVVDDQPALALGYAEASELMTDAPSIEWSTDSTHWYAGIIGDTWLRGSNAATNDVDFYRLDLPAGDHYAVELQALAGRFGSILDPALSLFDASGHLLASNEDALREGFLSDAEIATGLDGGTYFIAVSAGGNLPDEVGGFDPLIPGSGRASRGSTGQYLLGVKVVSDTTVPEVVQASLEPNATVTEPLRHITVQFSEAMNLRGLELGASLTHSDGSSVALVAVSYDANTREVRYQLSDRPASGSYVFTLHASHVTDLANNPLAGGAQGGDFELPFQIATPGVQNVDIELNNTPESAQDLGVFYTNELKAGFVINGTVNADVDGDRDYFRFEVGRAGFYTFRLRPGAGTNQTGLLRIHDAEGNQLAQGFRFPGFGSMLLRFLNPGEYLIQMDAAASLAGAAYELRISATSDPELPLRNNAANPSIQAVLRSHDGERAVTDVDTGIDVEPEALPSDANSYAVRSLPAVASQPVGRSEVSAAGRAELAFADSVTNGRLFPPGFVLRDSSEPVVHFGVTSVSGSFLHPLTDSISPDLAGADAPVAVSELLAALRGSLLEHDIGSGEYPGPAAQARAVSELPETPDERETAEREAIQVAGAPSTIALGMAAGIGVASFVSAPNRRRDSGLLQQTLDVLCQ